MLQPVSLKDPDFAAQVRDLAPDVIVVVAFRVLPPEVFRIPKIGSFNLHASLLPKYRGAAPINWAIINGEKETGVTTFLLQEKVDRGSMVLQARIPIADDDDAGTIHDRLAEVGAEIVLQTVRLLEQDRAKPRVQDETKASLAPKIFKENCRINWNRPAAGIRNLIRGLSPYPAAFTTHDGRVLKIYKATVLPSGATGPAGSVVVSRTSLTVATADAMLDIVELQQEGRKRMGIEEFLRGYRITTGAMLE